ncbi:MAG: SDR family NAD(P)-dependent oxidoreductase [Spirochaetaceae bacterium]|nr:SDR family NAD(P)-dependent oxidoreductase [Spirochaetaceae bacterium]
MKNILVTGAAGFIGSRTCEKLTDYGYKVTAVDNINDYYDVRLKEYRLKRLAKKPVEFHKIDIENYIKLKNLFKEKKFDAVINLAARAGVRASIENPDIYFSTNVQGTLNLLKLCTEHKINKFVLASTSSLYSGEPTPFSEKCPVNEPISPYAASKKAAEAISYTYHYLYNIDVTVVRYFTVYGPAGRPDMSPLRFIHSIVEGKALKLFGDGNQSRDFTYIDDIAEGTIKALAPAGYEIINLGGGKNPLTINNFIKAIEEKTGKKAIIEKFSFNKADMKETMADISKAISLLGWKPVTEIDEGIGKTVEWYFENRDLMKGIDY